METTNGVSSRLSSFRGAASTGMVFFSSAGWAALAAGAVWDQAAGASASVQVSASRSRRGGVAWGVGFMRIRIGFLSPGEIQRGKRKEAAAEVVG